MKSRKIQVALAVLVLLLGGCAVFFYMERTVVNKIRDTVQHLAPDLSVGQVKFSLWDKQVRLHDLRLEYRQAGQPIVCEVREVECLIPLEMIFDTPTGFTEVLTAGVARDITVTTPGLVSTIGERSLRHVQADLTALAPLLSGAVDRAEMGFLLTTNMAYAEGGSQDVRLTFSPESAETILRLHVASTAERQYDRGNLGSLQAKDIHFFTGDREQAIMEEFSLRGLHVPPAPLLRSLFNAPSDMTTEQSMALLRQLAVCPQPLVEQVRLHNIVLQNADLPARVRLLGVDWRSTYPAAYGLMVEDCALPAAPLADRLSVRLPGLDTLHVHFQVDVTNDAQGRERQELSLAVRDVGSLQLDATVVRSPLTQGDPLLGMFLAQIVSADLLLEDSNLLAYLGGSMHPQGTGVEERLRRLARELSTQYLDPVSAARVQEQLGAFIHAPGTLRVRLAPGEPLAILELASGTTDLASILTVTATPGTGSLEERIRELFAPRP